MENYGLPGWIKLKGFEDGSAELERTVEGLREKIEEDFSNPLCNADHIIIGSGTPLPRNAYISFGVQNGSMSIDEANKGRVEYFGSLKQSNKRDFRHVEITQRGEELIYEELVSLFGESYKFAEPLKKLFGEGEKRIERIGYDFFTGVGLFKDESFIPAYEAQEEARKFGAHALEFRYEFFPFDEKTGIAKPARVREIIINDITNPIMGGEVKVIRDGELLNEIRPNLIQPYRYSYLIPNEGEGYQVLNANNLPEVREFLRERWMGENGQT